MNYRQAEPGDVEAIARIHIAGWQAAYREMLPAALLDSLDLAERIETWSKRLADDGIVTLVADNNGEVNGFCSSGPSRDAGAAPDVWEIYSLYILPELRGNGIGTVLFELALTTGRARGAQLSTLWVAEKNHPARTFYELRGMTADGAQESRSTGQGAALEHVRYALNLA